MNGRFFKTILFLLPVLFCFTCKSPPPQAPVEAPSQPPGAQLRFERIEAQSTSRVSLFYNLAVENSHPFALRAVVKNWDITLNNVSAPVSAESAALFFEEEGMARPVEGTEMVLEGGTRRELFLRLDLDLSCFPGWDGEELTDYHADLALNVSYGFPAGKTADGVAGAFASFPRIREPELTITRIAILQAELINTRFRVSVRIDNPNFFPVDLSSFEYALYGDGRFWADGEQKRVLHVPAGMSEEARLFLTMNFIGMQRSLLDEVINMENVRYRLAGDVLVETGVAWLPRFRMDFDKSGFSEVFE